MNGNGAARTNRIGRTREDKGSGDATRDGQAEGIVMGIESVEGPHPRHNRTLEGVNIIRAIQPGGGSIPKVRMHIHDTDGAISSAQRITSEADQPWDDPRTIHIMNDDISFRCIEARQQTADMPNPLDNTLVKQNVRIDNFRPILLARPYSRV